MSKLRVSEEEIKRSIEYYKKKINGDELISIMRELLKYRKKYGNL